MSHRTGRGSRCTRRVAFGLAVGTLVVPFALHAEVSSTRSGQGNQPPVAVDSEAYTVAGTPVEVTLQATDPDGPGPYTFTIVSEPTSGALEPVAGPVFLYTPDGGFTGWDQFVWTVHDGIDSSGPATVDVLVNGLPVARPQTGMLGVDAELALDLDAEDDGLPGPPIFGVKSPPSHGDLFEDPPGVYFYRPDPHFAGEDSFDWNVSDGAEVSATVTFSLIVNDPPLARDQTILTQLDEPITIVLDGSDDGYPGEYSVHLLSAPLGSLVGQGFGTYLYTPPPGWSGVDSFRWSMTDGLEESNEATVTVIVNAPPEAREQNEATNLDQPLTGVLDWSDDGLPGPLEIQVTTLPFHGELVLGEPLGSFTYTPAPGYTGSDRFRWRLGDGSLWTPVVDFWVQVNAPPVAYDQQVKTERDVEVTFELSVRDDGFPGGYVLIEQDPLDNGTLTETEPGFYRYTPDPGFSGFDTLVWSVDDGMAESNTATASFAVNGPPEARDQLVFVDVDTPRTFVLDAVDDGLPGPLVYTIEREPFHGTVEEVDLGVYVYTPDPGYVGTDDLRWSVTDGIDTTPWATATFGISDEAQARVVPDRLVLGQYTGGEPIVASVSLVNLGIVGLEWAPVDEAPGFEISVEPAGGLLEGETTAELEITIGVQGLPPGRHSGVLFLRDLPGRTTYGSIEISLEIRDPDAERDGPGEIGVEAWIPPDPRQQLARHLRYRPADGQLVDLDPPRFSWPYESGVVEPWGDYQADNLFTLEVAADPEFSQLAIEVRDTPYNFHNFLPSLGAAGPWYWRVGYDVGTPSEVWSATRSFEIAADAVPWDRSGFEQQLASLGGHPRMFFDPATLPVLAGLKDENERSLAVYTEMISGVAAAKKAAWWNDFPTDDCPPGTDPQSPSCGYSFLMIGQQLAMVAFVHKVFGGEDFLDLKQKILRLASYPPGGWSSPEGLNPGSAFKDPTHLTHILGLFYDWFYDDLQPWERGVIRDSLEWRIGHLLYDFAWTRERPWGPTIEFDGISRIGWSHPYEAIMPTLLGSLAVYEDLPVAQEAVRLGLHFLVGVTSSYGEDEAWNEGAGYGNDKFQMLLEALFGIDVALPGLDIWKIDALRGLGDFFSRVTPVGAEHSSFGNRGYWRWDWMASRAKVMSILAMATGNRQAAANLEATSTLVSENHHLIFVEFPWVHYTLPAYYQEPTPEVEAETSAVFPLEGWVTASSAPPSDLLAQPEAVSMTFQARPRGGYGHSFASDNAFDLLAYGRTVAVGGGTSDNDLQFPRESLSHNTVLVDGYGQVQDLFEAYSENGFETALADLGASVRARVIAWKEGEAGGVPYVYWAGSAAGAYPAEAGVERFVRHVVFVDGRWFVIYDDLRTAPGHSSTFDWLYHTVPGEGMPVSFDPATFSFEYVVPVVAESEPIEVSVLVRHIAGTDNLTFLDLVGQAGQVNVTRCGRDPQPGSCEEDYRFEGVEGQNAVVDGHHLWVSTRDRSREARFLAVIVPWREGQQARPEIRRVNSSDRVVDVTFEGRRISVSFDPRVPGDIDVDPEAIAFRDDVPEP